MKDNSEVIDKLKREYETMQKEYIRKLALQAMSPSVPPTTDPKLIPVYSMAEIALHDGTRLEFMTKASPAIAQSAVKQIKDTGYLILWNDTDSLCVPADQIKHFCMREVTKK